MLLVLVLSFYTTGVLACYFGTVNTQGDLDKVAKLILLFLSLLWPWLYLFTQLIKWAEKEW